MLLLLDLLSYLAGVVKWIAKDKLNLCFIPLKIASVCQLKLKLYAGFVLRINTASDLGEGDYDMLDLNRNSLARRYDIPSPILFGSDPRQPSLRAGYGV